MNSMKSTAGGMKKKSFQVDGGVSRFKYDEDYYPSDGEEIRSYSLIVKKDLAKMMEACENMPCCYKEYLALGKKICVEISFKEYIYLQYRIWPKDVDENSFKSIKLSIEEPSCSNSVIKE